MEKPDENTENPAKNEENGKNQTVTRNTAIKVRLYPTPEQAALFEKTFGCCRWLWNRMLADEREFYAATGKHFIPTPARYKKEAPFLREVDSNALVAVHQNLKLAFQLFFKKPEHYGYPEFKKKQNTRNSFLSYCHHYDTGQPDSIYLTPSGIRLPKAGIVPAKLHRRPLHWWVLKNVTVSRSASGKYYASLLYQYTEKQREKAPPDPEKALGLNYSLTRFYVASDGSAADAPRYLAQSQEKMSEMQRRLSRMEKGSKNYEEQLQKIRLLHERIANQRRDYIHKESRRLADDWDLVCVRGDDLRQVAKAVKLGNVKDSGFGMFRSCLAYKLDREGKHFVALERSAPTARRCHVCGGVVDALPSRARKWVCPSCGALLQRDANSAINIRELGLAQFQHDEQ